MTKMLLMDDIHVSVYAPRGLPDPEASAIYRTLKLARFRRQLRQAVVAMVRRYSALRKVHIVVSR